MSGNKRSNDPIVREILGKACNSGQGLLQLLLQLLQMLLQAQNEVTICCEVQAA